MMLPVLRSYWTSFDEIPKYKKKTKSSISKAECKADHKHQYRKCLLIYEEHPYLAHYCTNCGKVRNWSRCIQKSENGYRELRDDEVFDSVEVKEYLSDEKNSI